MGTLNLWNNTRKNPWSVVGLLLVVAFVVWMFMVESKGMRLGKTSYEYCNSLCDVYETVGKTFCWAVYLMMTYLTYINKQYSRWTIWLFYVVAVGMLVYYVGAGYVLDYVYNHIGADYMYLLPSLARSLYGGPVFLIILSFFFVPKFLKDTMKLKRDQELTV